MAKVSTRDFIYTRIIIILSSIACIVCYIKLTKSYDISFIDGEGTIFSISPISKKAFCTLSFAISVILLVSNVYFFVIRICTCCCCCCSQLEDCNLFLSKVFNLFSFILEIMIFSILFNVYGKVKSGHYSDGLLENYSPYGKYRHAIYDIYQLGEDSQYCDIIQGFNPSLFKTYLSEASCASASTTYSGINNYYDDDYHGNTTKLNGELMFSSCENEAMKDLKKYSLGMGICHVINFAGLWGVLLYIYSESDINFITDLIMTYPVILLIVLSPLLKIIYSFIIPDVYDSKIDFKVNLKNNDDFGSVYYRFLNYFLYGNIGDLFFTLLCLLLLYLQLKKKSASYTRGVKMACGIFLLLVSIWEILQLGFDGYYYYLVKNDPTNYFINSFGKKVNEVYEIITNPIDSLSPLIFPHTNIVELIKFFRNYEIRNSCEGIGCKTTPSVALKDELLIEIILISITFVIDILLAIVMFHSYRKNLKSPESFKSDISKAHIIPEYQNQESLSKEDTNEESSQSSYSTLDRIAEYFEKTLFKINKSAMSDHEFISFKDKVRLEYFNCQFPYVKKIFRYYTQDEGYKLINGYLYGEKGNSFKDGRGITNDLLTLRNNSVNSNTVLDSLSQLTVENIDVRSLINIMTTIIHLCPTMRPIIVHRYTSIKVFIGLMNEMFNPNPSNKYQEFEDANIEDREQFINMIVRNQLVGKKIQTTAFMSTSLSEIFEPFCNMDVHFVIKVDKYARGIHIKSISEFANEDELLFQRRQIFRINRTCLTTKKKIPEENQFYIDVSLINITPKEVQHINIYN